MHEFFDLIRVANAVLAFTAAISFAVRLSDDWELFKPGRSLGDIGWHNPLGFLLLLIAVAAGSGQAFARDLELTIGAPLLTVGLFLVLLGLWKTRRN